MSAYNMSPFFEYYADDLAPFYEKKYEFLIDFNEELCRMVCELIDIHPTMERTSEYKMEFAPGEFDFREVIHPQKGFPRSGYRVYSATLLSGFRAQTGFSS